MKQFTLELLLKIIGIGSASGLLIDQGTLHFVSDDSGFLYQYDQKSAVISKTALLPGAAEHMAKKIKPDFESLFYADGTTYIFGSGSRANRMIAATICNKSVSTHDLAPLYTSMQNISGISGDDFNIEGAVRYDDKWHFFQRGNGKRMKNGVFIVDGDIFSVDADIRYVDVPLPEISGVRAGFTDAEYVNGRLFFLAVAENSASTYADGAIAGCLFGELDPKNFSITDSVTISKNQKFEGLAYRGKSGRRLEFLLCEDDDSGRPETPVYRLSIKK